jgi:colicin import membrane protein
MSKFGRFALLLAAGCGLAACAGMTGEPAVPLPGLDPATIQDRDSAEQALEAVSAARRELERSLGERERACYKRFLVNSCLEDVLDERRLAERRFRQIEIRSREAIRQTRAIERATEEARRIEERSASDAAERAARDERVSASRRREAEQLEREAARREEERQRADRARASEAQARERDAGLARRRADAQRRAADSAARTTEHEQRVRQHEAQERQRVERQDKSAVPNDGKGDLKPENRDADPAKD